MSVETEKLCPTCKTGKDTYILDEKIHSVPTCISTMGRVARCIKN